MEEEDEKGEAEVIERQKEGAEARTGSFDALSWRQWNS